MLNIPSKADKFRTALIDSLRIITWEHFKQQNNVGGFEAYQQFHTKWIEHSVHQQTYNELVAFAQSLGYTQDELLMLRHKYYSRRQQAIQAQQVQSQQAQSELPPIPDDLF